eukprot:scaffold1118_cov127-Isochrysis_galbana.AAC.5
MINYPLCLAVAGLMSANAPARSNLQARTILSSCHAVSRVTPGRVVTAATAHMDDDPRDP